MKSSELLKAAYAILSEGPHRWTKGVFARDAEGRTIAHPYDQAACFCGIGALEAAACKFSYLSYGPDCLFIQAQLKLSVVAHGDWVAFNDDRYTTYEQMLAKYREAIELAEADER